MVVAIKAISTPNKVHHRSMSHEWSNQIFQVVHIISYSQPDGPLPFLWSCASVRLKVIGLIRKTPEGAEYGDEYESKQEPYLHN